MSPASLAMMEVWHGDRNIAFARVDGFGPNAFLVSSYHTEPLDEDAVV